MIGNNEMTRIKDNKIKKLKDEPTKMIPTKL